MPAACTWCVRHQLLCRAGRHFLGCSPYQFAVRSSNIGFAGPGVIKETTGMDIPPKYHRSYRALSRGHIQGIWDRRQVRANLKQALLTIGGRNLYYR